MRNAPDIAGTLFFLFAVFYLYYILEVRRDVNTREPRPLKNFLTGQVGVKRLRGEWCDCVRSLSLNNSEADAPANPLKQTTCSEFSHLRGGKQKVVSFSYYERNKKLSEKRKTTGEVEANVFLDGLEINIDLLPRLYPGFTIRLYHNTAGDDPLMSKLCSLACSNTDLVDLCHVKTIPRSLGPRHTADMFPMLWRFLPTLDLDVSVVMSRDLDSRFTEREAAAVMEWLESNKSLHAMRDHPWHGVPIMGGGWGAKLDTQHRRDNWKTSWKKMLSDSRLYSGSDKKGPDQDLLQKYVWNIWGRSDSLHHDSYTCSRYPGSTGWPTQRINTTDHNFFGAVGQY